jgi:hypothetical protein
MNAAGGNIDLYAEGSDIEVLQLIVKIDAFDCEDNTVIIVGGVGDKPQQ